MANAIIGHYDCTYGGGVHLSSPLASVAVANKLCQSFQTFNISYSDTGLLGAHFVCDAMSIDDMVSSCKASGCAYVPVLQRVR